MANRIQFRRDTAANWTRVNPILEDGEPGLETDTNYIKYGDGNTAWTALPYASTGSGSVSFEYSTVQEGSLGGNVPRGFELNLLLRNGSAQVAVDVYVSGVGYQRNLFCRG